MKSIYSVYQINSYIHKMFGEDYLLSDVSVTGEISNLKYHSTGHIYFTLKDDQSAISCAIFRSSADKLKIKLNNGDKIIASGAINNYISGGSITFNVSSVEPAGTGDLKKKYEELKKKLRDQGMFDEEFKLPIPKFPKTIGIVTAPTGAAVRDIISVAKRRNPYISLVLYPAIVQGADAAASIVKGIETLENYGVDLMIVGRGGGSLEDLWAFNEEEVAYAIFQSTTPIISAVGHEIDYTIADYVADLRAATPSAAAEIAVPDMASLVDDIDTYNKRLDLAIKNLINAKKNKIILYDTKINALSPTGIVKKQRLKLDSLNLKTEYAIKNIIYKNRYSLSTYEERLKGLSPLDRLSQGMAYVVSKEGKRISGISDVKADDTIKIILRDGNVEAKVLQINGD